VIEEDEMKEFDARTKDKIGAYVYCLLDKGEPFYIGKGNGNRVFDHAANALKNPSESHKVERIKKILDAGNRVEHLIIQHGLDDKTALAIEAALIDFANYFDMGLTNVVLGHKSSAFGIMTVEEIERKYHAPPLEALGEGMMIININRTYRRAEGVDSIYEATRQSWVIDKKRIPKLKYVLAESTGFVGEVFEVERWYQVETPDGRTRWAFEGKRASDEIRSRYLNRAISKKRGAANPISFNLSPRLAKK
jgi:hypothetical protein